MKLYPSNNTWNVSNGTKEISKTEKQKHNIEDKFQEVNILTSRKLIFWSYEQCNQNISGALGIVRSGLL